MIVAIYISQKYFLYVNSDVVQMRIFGGFFPKWLAERSAISFIMHLFNGYIRSQQLSYFNYCH